MSISRIKQIKRILKEHDVRDPRGALQAIADVIAQPKPDPIKPLLQLQLVRTGEKQATSEVKCDRENLKPTHLGFAIESLNDFGNDLFGACDDPNCPVHGTNAVAGAGLVSLGELFKKFEAEALAKKGGTQ